MPPVGKGGDAEGDEGVILRWMIFVCYRGGEEEEETEVDRE